MEIFFKSLFFLLRLRTIFIFF